jgi:hypothetical protein
MSSLKFKHAEKINLLRKTTEFAAEQFGVKIDFDIDERDGTVTVFLDSTCELVGQLRYSQKYHAKEDPDVMVDRILKQIVLLKNFREYVDLNKHLMRAANNQTQLFWKKGGDVWKSFIESVTKKEEDQT